MWSTMMPFQLTLGGILERAGKLFPRVEIAWRTSSGEVQRYTYREFHDRARKLAEALQRLGIKRGERVGTLMNNHAAHLETYFGAAAAGAVVHPLNLRLHANDISFIVNHAQDRVLVVDDAVLATVEQFKDRVDVEKIIVVPSMGEAVRGPYLDYERLIGESHGNFSHPSLHENEAAVMCYTTGTAGSPKGIVYSHRALVLHALALSLPDFAAIAQRDVAMPVVPMYHANAFGLPIATMMIGCKQVLPGAQTDARSLIELFSAEQVTLSGGVPSVWNDVMHEIDRAPEQWKPAIGLRAIVSGAAPAEPVMRALDKRGLRLIQGWGLIETDALATVATIPPELESAQVDQQYAARMSLGRPLPFVDVRVIGDMGEVPQNGQAMGEVQLRGPFVTGSYYNLPELRGKWTDDGWFRTGDVVTVNSRGEMKMADRAKDLIRAGNEWISSVNLENELMGHPAVREAAVIAVAHAEHGEKPLAVVALKDSAPSTSTSELREFLAQKFAAWQLPEAIVFVESLPHTPTGKLLKKELRKQFKDWKWAAGVASGERVIS
jgi:fatty-acyl-CoA synthase